MKKKELKNIATKIAAAEKILCESADPMVKREAEQEIFRLSGKVTSLEDMVIIDDMVQEILSKS